MPLVPPCTSSVSPARIAAAWKTVDHTVQAASGRPAASTTRHASRNRQQLTGRYRDLLCVAATGEQRAHLVADGPALDVRPGGDDAPGAFEAEDRRCSRRGRVVPGALREVGSVQACGADGDDHLACAQAPDRATSVQAKTSAVPGLVMVMACTTATLGSVRSAACIHHKSD